VKIFEKDFRRVASSILGQVQSNLRGLRAEPQHAELVEELEGILREIDAELRCLTYLS
jgi:hypothetical protein